MKKFTIEISRLKKGPKELAYQLPITAKVIQRLPGKDRPDYFLAKLENNLVWKAHPEMKPKEITHLVLCTKYKEHHIDPEMNDVLIAIAYVIDESLLNENTLNFNKCKYIALGEASVLKKWNIFK
ncbi:MAG: hypothetical protein FH748_02650 [Balneolaceae bacterium]|nr:hypothetical protein [Balneolaceae bacterium]